MRAHKNTELFIGPEFVFLPLRRSDRPAYIIDPEDANTEAATGKTIEFLHMYPCMGLEHAHELQQVLLARCKTHVVAAAVVRVAILDLRTIEILCITTLMTLFRSNWRKAIGTSSCINYVFKTNQNLSQQILGVTSQLNMFAS